VPRRAPLPPPHPFPTRRSSDLKAWGIHADSALGHSVGEFAAACLAGVFELEDAMRLVAARGRLMQAQPTGTMLAIRAPVEQVRRSEEHTSELQSRENLVCRLLL